MFKKALFFLLFAAGGFGVGALIGRSSDSIEADAVWLSVLPLVIFLVLLWHELGHIWGGGLAGFRFHMLAVGPLRIDARPEGWKWSWNRSAALWGGVAATTPEEGRGPGLQNLAPRMMQMVAGGPLASLVGALGALLVAYLAGPGPVQLVAGMFGLMSGAITIATAIPQCMGQFKSDGQRILELWRGGREAERWCALSALSSLATKYRPREWPQALVEEATAWVDDSYDGVSGAWLRHTWHLDRRELAAAREWLEVAVAKVEHWPPPARGLVHASAAYFYAMEEDNREQARRHWELAQGHGFLAPEGKALAEAAVAYVNGEKDKAKQAAAKGRELAGKQAGSAGEAMREYFALIEARAGN